MDLMTLAAKLTLDDSSYRSGIDNATSMGQQLAGKMSAWTVTIGNLAADMVKKAASSITSIYSSAMDSYADYQQLIGGVETLFKTSSDKVAAYAANSYKTTGLSANDYMETVTSFSASLLQGLGGDTEAAADLADVAITDMADNANKLGTDISSIQTAYQGFAKQNYTMLDNLKLGYGGTADEMVRLINDSGTLETEIKDLDNVTFDQMIEAIHAIQEEMGITGTTAKEASDTISGSKASLVAAWNDLMAAVGGSTLTDLDTAAANFQASFSAYMTNLLPTLVTTVANSGTLVQAIANAISALPTSLLADVTDTRLGAGAQMINAVSDLVNWLLDNIVTTFEQLSIDDSKVVAFGQALGAFLGNTAENLISNFPAIITGMIDIGVTLAGSILSGIWDGLFGDESSEEIDRINQELTDSIVDANVQAAKAQSILSYMSDLEKQYGNAATETDEWKRAETELETVLSGSTEAFNTFGDNVSGAITYLQTMTEELRKQAILNAYGDKITSLYKAQAEAQVELDEANWTISENTGTINTLNQQLIDTARAYRTEAYNLGLYNGLNDVQRQSVFGLPINSTENAELVIDGLATLLETYYKDNNVSEKNQIWNRDLTDNILPESEFDEFGKKIEAANSKIEAAQSTVDTATQQIASYDAEIAKTQAMMAQTQASLSSLSSAASVAATSISTGLSSAISTVSGMASTLLNNDSGTYMPRAVGIDYVPTNGFRTELHRGEAVITAEENKRRLNGYNDYSAMEDALTGAIESAMSRMYIGMNGEKVADFTTKRIDRNISASNNYRMRSMGG